MPLVRTIDNLPEGTTLKSLSCCPVADLPQSAVMNCVPRAEYPNYNPNDTLAQIIVDAWRDTNFRQRLLDPDTTEEVLRERGLFFAVKNPRVMTHEDFDSLIVPEDEVVLVLPERPEHLPELGNILDSARAAMAYTPVGI